MWKDGKQNKKNPKEFVGIQNQGATCYLNTLLQTLYMSPEVKDAINRSNVKPIKNFNKTTSICYQLKELFAKLDAKETANTRGITRSLGMSSQDVYRQQDVEEYFRLLVNKVVAESDEETCEILQIYQSTVINSLKCLDCEAEAPEECILLDIPLPVHSNECGTSIPSVNAVLQDFLKATILDGDNLCYCDNCKKKTKTLTKYYFENLPQILVLQLKRFEYDYVKMSFVKLKNEVEIPLKLKFQKEDKINGKIEWCLSSTEPKETAKMHKRRRNSSPGPLFSEKSRSHELEERQKPQRNESQQESKETAKIQRKQRSHSKEPELYERSRRHAFEENKNPQRGERQRESKESKDGYFNHQRSSSVGSKRHRNCESEECQKIYTTYNLFAICHHFGEFNRGHYVAQIKPDSSSKWYCFDDSHVTEENFFPEATHDNTVGTPRRSSATAYLLMYRKEKVNSCQEYVRRINADKEAEKIKPAGMCNQRESGGMRAGENNGHLQQSNETFYQSLDPPGKNQTQAKNRDEMIRKTEHRNLEETMKEPVIGDESDEKNIKDRNETRAKKTEKCTQDTHRCEQAELNSIQSESKDEEKRPLIKGGKQMESGMPEFEEIEEYQIEELSVIDSKVGEKNKLKYNGWFHRSVMENIRYVGRSLKRGFCGCFEHNLRGNENEKSMN